MTKTQEIREELISVFSGKKIKILDSIIPLVAFLVLNQLLGLNSATIFSLISAGIFVVYRTWTGDKLIYAFVGALGVIAAAGIAYFSGSDTGFFIPGLITGALTVILCIGSVLIKKPIAAWSSRITRRWPKNWYAHEKIRPAYTEVTIAWAMAFGLRTFLEYWLLSQNAINAAGAVKIFLGWPYTIVILILSYIYGSWRLKNLGGPSVEEFKDKKLPPWEGQLRGF